VAKRWSRNELITLARAGAQKRIVELRAELAALERLVGRGAERVREAAPVRRHMSKDARERIAAAARRRWAKWRKEKGKS